MLCQIYGILESAAKDSFHELVCGVGRCSDCPTPDAQPGVHWSPAEASAVVAWHREAAASESAKKQLMTPIGKATPKVKSELPSEDDDNLQKQVRAAVKEALEAKQQEQGIKGAKAKDGGKLRLGRDLREDRPAHPRDHARCFPRHQSGWPTFLHYCPLFSRETEFTNFVSEEIAQIVPVTTRGGVGSQCLPARAIVRAVTATKHDLGFSPSYRVVSNGSAMEVWAFMVRLSHHQRALGTWRGAAVASRMGPLAFSGDKRGRSKALFFAVLNGTSISDPEPVIFSCDPEDWACGQATSEATAKYIISARISFPARLAIVPLLDWLPACMAHDFCNREDPRRARRRLFILCCDPTTVARLRSHTTTLQTGLCAATLFP